MWRCKKCGCEVSGLGGVTYETCGELDKKGNIKKHIILEEIDSETDSYQCDGCGATDQFLDEIAKWVE